METITALLDTEELLRLLTAELSRTMSCDYDIIKVQKFTSDANWYIIKPSNIQAAYLIGRIVAFIA